MHALDTPYDQLQPLPRPTWLPTLTAAVGTREARLDHAAAWLDALGGGKLPAATADFGDAAASAPLRRVAGELGLPALAQGLTALAEQILRSAFWHLDRINALQPRRTRAQAIAAITEEFRASWQIETAGLESELALLRELASGSLLQWDQLRGRLRTREWQAARRAAERLAELPELQALLKRLGRREFSARRTPQPAPERPRPQARVPLRAVATLLAGAPGEITGIRLDSRIEHMLPSEALGLRHPLLRRLWRARQAEGRLLAHDTAALVFDWRPDPDGRARDTGRAPEQLARERGPIVLCLDTSGSMRGAPENVAKAVALAALRLARQTGRGCRLLAFGGPDEVIEQDIAEGGLAAMLRLMGQAFDGGTDIQTPIERAIARIHEAGWAGADLLIVSDGEFGCVPATLQKLDAARQELGLHVQGVLIGDRETLGLLEVCDDIHWVRDWRRHADSADAELRADRRGASPVHSKSLTALYFPNALSPAARQRLGGGEAG
ncbi:VWA domain-containing protein [Rubrivivax sp. A210]|uniref:vWA domain-containing protein n=1 Tax=Rubrivivax sp. A210 TaxID=2772301 RepID=UPI0019196C66|nr:VWA domain-containing protein [Rubrivivax sp. A210]CAD5373879.1 VWA domain-containing protein [Rubrivivax sp. A210]